MPADRLIHPKLGHSAKVSHLPDFDFRVWIQFLLSADDFGVMRATATAFKSGNDAIDVRTSKAVDRAIRHIVDKGLVVVFEHQGARYLCQLDWQKWQKIEYPRTTHNPCPPETVLAQCSPATRALFEKYPGGAGKSPKKPRSIPEDSPKVPQMISEGSPPTRAGVPAKRLTANGKWLTADLSEERLDLAFVRFQDAYPANRRVGGYRAQTAFVDAAAKATVAAVFAALENHKASAQWASPKLIPSMDRWLADELWRQELPATEVARSPGDAWRPEGQ